MITSFLLRSILFGCVTLLEEHKVEATSNPSSKKQLIADSKIVNKKSPAQKVRQKKNISERTSNLTLFATRPLGHCATCKVYLTPKMNITFFFFFYQKLDAEYFFIRQFFRKKHYFPRKP